MARLMQYDSADYIREATVEEARLSAEAGLRDGGVGAIEIDGITCYVDGFECACGEALTPSEIERNAIENEEQDGNGFICDACAAI